MDDSGCCACSSGDRNPECQGVFARIGIVKAHWECWTNCNLSCAFCYRTREVPMDTVAAAAVLRAIRFGGVERIVFAGGDPSIRADVPELVRLCQCLGMSVEIQTNAQRISPEFLGTLSDCRLVGVSLDGPTAEVHDRIREMAGNFDRTMKLIEHLERNCRRVVVRTMVCKGNAETMDRIGRLLSSYTCIVRWSVVEFSAVGQGALNRETYAVSQERFEEAGRVAQVNYTGGAEVDVYANHQKTGAYLLVTAAGRAYTTVGTLQGLHYPTSGSLLTDHLTSITKELKFSSELHQIRYARF